MSDLWLNSVVLIKSSDPTNDGFGTGFLIYGEGQAAYILTCAHVVRDIGGSDLLKVADVPATLVASGSEDGVDLAVLRVEGLLEKLPLCLRRAAHEEGKFFSTAGFERPNKDFFTRRRLKGVFGQQIQVGGMQTKFIKAWDLKITDDDYQLQQGYSGSPVVDDSNCAVGIVNTRRGGGKTGMAIAVEALEKVWTEMPPGLLAEEEWQPPVGTVLYTCGHSGGVVAWSPDGRYLASVDYEKIASDNTRVQVYDANWQVVPDAKVSVPIVQVWDAATGQYLLSYRGQTDAFDVPAITWSPDSRRLASADRDGTVQVWDAATGRHLLTYEGHTGDVEAVAWSPDGRRLASAGDDTTVQVWDAATGGHIYTYRRHTGSVYAVAWSPDSRRLASASNDSPVQVWQAP